MSTNEVKKVVVVRRKRSGFDRTERSSTLDIIRKPRLSQASSLNQLTSEQAKAVGERFFKARLLQIA